MFRVPDLMRRVTLRVDHHADRPLIAWRTLR